MTNKPRVLIEDMDNLTFQMFLRTEKFFPTLHESQSDKPDLICLTGGWDVQPHLYGEENIESSCNPTRDKWCKDLWDRYPDTPRVGICRGGQFLNVMSGGAMWQDVDGHCGTHEVINLLDIPSTGFNMGTKFKVTSTHHQMMIPGPDGEVLTIAKKASKFKSGRVREIPAFDTEVVWYEKTQSLCYQPHPEYDGAPVNRVYFFDLIKHLLGMGK